MADGDRALGMDRPIARRDFLGGIAAAGAFIAGGGRADATAAQDRPGYDPSILTGLRGSHPGSFEAAHALRDGDPAAGPVEPTGEGYDLIVVGAGIGGLAAAHFFTRARPGARVLVLDNHDDFGGHAKRNEFSVDGRTLIANGGTWAIESPYPYSAVAHGLLDELGIDPPRLEARDHHPEYYAGLGRGVFFARETFGVDRFVAGLPANPADDDAGPPRRPSRAEWTAFLTRTPLPPAACRDILRIETEGFDVFPGMTSDEKKDRLSRMSYRAYLLDVVRADPAVADFYGVRTHDLYGVGIDAVSALDCWGLGFAGFTGAGLAAGPHPRMGYTAKGAATPGQAPYTFHFPDGNATIARLLVRRLVPHAVPGTDDGDAVTARVDYAALDRAGARTRIRLNSIVVRVAHAGSPATARDVEVTYVRNGRRYAVRGARVVMACWNMIVPYVMPELPLDQRAALRDGAKVPLVYTRVALRTWNAFARLGVRAIEAPGMYHSAIALDEPVDIGTYRASRTPDEPIVVRMLRTPCAPGRSEREQHRIGRANLLATPFAVFERNIREQLGRVLGPAGFDPARDIAAITVNRWPHGYAYEYNPLWDPESYFRGGTTPNEIARRPFGRVTIANADAAAAAYTDKAIDEAHRAVQESLA